MDCDPWFEYAIMDVHNPSEIESDSVDLHSIPFAMKICDRGAVLREAMRILKPGAMFFCLEAARIPNDFLHTAYLKYMDWCLPAIGRLADALASHGFEDVSFEGMTFGIVAPRTAPEPHGLQAAENPDRACTLRICR